jgi:S1-C subfamily serine protease
MPRTKAFTGSIAKNSERVRQGVVTILVAAGHGSGFFIDDAGHLLTNAHVVRGTDRAKVVLAGGLEATANVLARDPRRDVALLKVDLGKTTALPLRAVKPAVGAEVYAMGSPFDPSLSATLSKGIVSAYRSMAGLDFIQSDVNVMGGSSGGPLLDTSGNVIGMTVSSVATGDLPMGLNYFIPIGDALRALGIGKAVRAAEKPAIAEPIDSTPPTSAAAQTTTQLAQTSISSLRLFDTGLQQNMPNIRASLAAVSVGTASGRGFFIDTKGHLLTNAHIVGSAKEVQVRLNSGGEFRGSVIALNPRLDLALVKVAETGGIGLPLQLIKPKLGTPVYAVGKVDGDDTSIVGNRGVVVYRAMDDMQIVKTLMSAQPAVEGTPLLDDMGNALGIAVAGLFPNDPSDVSFFITIADALRALGVGVAS